MHDAEENGINSYLVDSLKLFRDNKVFHHFGLNWNEAKKLTHEEFVFIMELSAEATKEENERTRNSLDNLQNDLKNKK